MSTSRLTILWLLLAPLLVSSACTPNTTDTAGLQALLNQGQADYTLQLCQNQIYSLTDTLNYTGANQEISTENYPTDDSRAVLLVTGTLQTTAVRAIDAGLNGVKLRNIQINGNRNDDPIYASPGPNIEFGGDTQNQLVEYVRTYNPRGWSCMHIAEGPFRCANATIQNNDIGPCGTDYFQMWADGISMSCSSSLVQNNVITDATDGGIVVFGAPYTVIRNNTIHAKTRTMLGGINLVDVLPWQPEGNFSGTVVQGNRINGGWATGLGNDTLGTQNTSAIIKIGIALGPNIWWGDGRYGTNRSMGGYVENNVFSGAFAFAMGISGAENFIVSNNSFTGNTSFIGSTGPNCTTGSFVPSLPIPLIYDTTQIVNVTITVPEPPTSGLWSNVPTSALGGFVNGTALGLVCTVPPATDVNAWPYGGEGVNAAVAGETSGTTTSAGPSGTSTSAGPSGTSSGTPSSPAGSTTPSTGSGTLVVRSADSIMLMATMISGVVLGVLTM